MQYLSRSSCEARPVRAADRQEIAAFDGFFAWPDMIVALDRTGRAVGVEVVRRPAMASRPRHFFNKRGRDDSPLSKV